METLPPGMPAPAALQTLAMRRYPLASLRRMRERYGPTFTVRVLDVPPLVFLSDAADIAAVLGASPEVLRPGAGTFTLVPLLGDGSFMSRDEDDHMAVRTALARPFARGAEEHHAAMVSQMVAEEVATWPTGRPVALSPRLRALTLRVIAKVVLGDDPLAPEVCARLLEMLAVTPTLLLLEPKLRHLPPWRGRWRQLQSDRLSLAKLVASIIAERRDGGGADVLHELLAVRAGDEGTRGRQEVVDDVISLLVAGHETTASVLAWSLQLLARSGDVQGRLAAELAAGAGERYLDATVSEVLRHAPVFIFAMPRAVSAPIEIAGWSYRAPTLLMPCLYLLHHDPAVYDAPYEFRPERFIERGEPHPPSAWMPWGGGRRRCLGQHLATLEIRTVLREVIGRFVVEPSRERPEPARWRTAILTPGRGCEVVLRPRAG